MADEAYRFTMAWDDGDNLNSDEYLSIFKTLVDAGAHLDIATISGYTVLNCLPTQFSVIIDVAIDAYFSSLKNSVFPLSCYCARVIRWEGIPFDKHRIPCHLQEFVSRHSAQGKLN
jgi:hypothetical protein